MKTVYFYPTQDSSAALKRFRSGEFDVVTGRRRSRFTGCNSISHQLRLSPFILSQYVQFNMRRKPFNDRRVRLALSLAIDREIMVTKVTRAGETAAYSFVPPGMPNYRAARLSFHDEPMPKRIARAKALLSAAGHGPDNPVTFDFNTSNTTELLAARRRGLSGHVERCRRQGPPHAL